MRVESDPGMMGGAIAHEYMAPSEAGEDEIVFCPECGYAANVELAVAGRDEPRASAATGGEERARTRCTRPGSARSTRSLRFWASRRAGS